MALDGIDGAGANNSLTVNTSGFNANQFLSNASATAVTVRVNDKSSFCVAMSQAAFAKIRTPGLNLIRNAKVQVVGKAGN